MIDDTQAEETATSPSEEEQTVEETQEEETGKVPYDRFKEVVDERNKYKELLSSVQEKETETTPEAAMDEDALRIVDKRAESIVNRRLSEVEKKLELDKTIAQNPDFFKFADSIKDKIKENPHLSWDDAYKLSKFESVQTESREAGKQEAYQKIQEKKAAGTESASKAKSASGGVETIDPLAKGPDGKHLYSLKELEDILPKA